MIPPNFLQYNNVTLTCSIKSSRDTKNCGQVINMSPDVPTIAIRWIITRKNCIESLPFKVLGSRKIINVTYAKISAKFRWNLAKDFFVIKNLLCPPYSQGTHEMKDDTFKSWINKLSWVFEIMVENLDKNLIFGRG